MIYFLLYSLAYLPTFALCLIGLVAFAAWETFRPRASKASDQVYGGEQ